MFNRLKQVLCISFLVIFMICSDKTSDKYDQNKIIYETESICSSNKVIPITIEFLEYPGYSEDVLYDMELIAQLVQAEAGNQDLTGMRYVADVVLNRVDSDEFPDTVEEVIFQKNQFTVIESGYFDMIKNDISEEAYEAVLLEYEERLNYDILYFSKGKSKYMKTDSFKYDDHWFGW